jgi:DNA mismatch repair protein MutS
MIERLAEIGAKTMFATHYHQLNVLADDIPVIRNYRVSVQEIGDQVVWTHRVLAGGTDRSYGIHVARAAGMPSAVLHRAASILAELENQSERPKTVSPAARMQLTLFEAEEPAVVQELRGLDVESLTPLQALQWLDQWKQKVGK